MINAITRIDKSVGRSIMAWPKWLHPLMFTLTTIGHPVFSILTIAIITCLAVLGNDRLLLLAAAVAAGTFAFNSILKMVFRRPRPKTYKQEELVLMTYSFPSGHASSAVAIYGLVAILIAPLSVISAVLLAIMIAGIGVSRVYLGAHYVSDVVAGWIVGLVGLGIIVWIVQAL